LFVAAVIPNSCERDGAKSKKQVYEVGEWVEMDTQIKFIQNIKLHKIEHTTHTSKVAQTRHDKQQQIKNTKANGFPYPSINQSINIYKLSNRH
jgi:hypothetical protein